MEQTKKQTMTTITFSKPHDSQFSSAEVPSPAWWCILALWACKYSLKGICREEPSTGTPLPHSQQIEEKRRGGKEGGWVGWRQGERQRGGRRGTQNTSHHCYSPPSQGQQQRETCCPAFLLPSARPASLFHTDSERDCAFKQLIPTDRNSEQTKKKCTVKKYRMY